MAINLEAVVANDPIPPLNSSTNPNSVIGGQWVGIPFFNEMVKTNAGAPAWWSFARDKYLDNTTKTSDHLSSTVYSLQTRFVATPLRIIAKNPNIQDHKDKRDEMLYNLINYSEFGQGWDVAYNKF